MNITIGLKTRISFLKEHSN